jgi:hypothetical protein
LRGEVRVVRDPFALSERPKALEEPNIGDETGQAIFDSARQVACNGTAAISKKRQADVQRLGTRRERHSAAYTYFGLAFASIDAMPGHSAANHAAADLLHFAGNAFRESGQLNRAADAYWRSGTLAEPRSPLAVRSLARAKMLYTDIGQTGDADRMHVLEWDVRRFQVGLRELPGWVPKFIDVWFAKARGVLSLVLLWKVTSQYGTSLWRWLVSLGTMIALFSVAYRALHSHGALTAHHWSSLTPLYFCVVTAATVGYGEITPRTELAEIVVVANILFGYGLLGIGLTILGRKVVR